MNNNTFEFITPKSVLRMPAGFQIFVVAACYCIMTLAYFHEYKLTGKVAGYDPSVSLLFVPIYEEIIFRGIFLKYFEINYGKLRAIIFVSLLFGLYHLKNIFWRDVGAIADQVGYTALIFSPIVCWVTLKTRSVWPAVILHYLNNMPYHLLR